MGHGCPEIVPGDAHKTKQAFVAHGQHRLDCGDATIEHVEAGDAMSLVEIERVATEVRERCLKLRTHAVRLAAGGLLADEQLIAQGADCGPGNGFGLTVRGGNVDVVHAAGNRCAYRSIGLFGCAVPERGATKNGNAAVVSGAAKSTCLHGRTLSDRYSLHRMAGARYWA